jgi:hypothetical protein
MLRIEGGRVILRDWHIFDLQKPRMCLPDLRII